MHWPAEDGTPLEEYWQVLVDLKREGKIRAAGPSNPGIIQLEAASQVGNVDAIQPQFNLIHREAAADVLRWAREHQAGVIVYSPMASGLLTGAFTQGPGGGPGAGGLAGRPPRLHRARPVSQPGPGLPRCDRRDRRCPQPSAGRRVAAGRDPGT